MNRKNDTTIALAMPEPVETTRRGLLAGLAASCAMSRDVVIAAPGAAQIETPIDRVERLGHELAEALMAYAGGKFHAVIYPSDQAEMPIAFLASSADARRAGR